MLADFYILGFQMIWRSPDRKNHLGGGSNFVQKFGPFKKRLFWLKIKFSANFRQTILNSAWQFIHCCGQCWTLLDIGDIPSEIASSFCGSAFMVIWVCSDPKFGSKIIGSDPASATGRGLGNNETEFCKGKNWSWEKVEKVLYKKSFWKYGNSIFWSFKKSNRKFNFFRKLSKVVF